MSTIQSLIHFLSGNIMPLSLLLISMTYYILTSRAQRIQNFAYALINAGIKPGDRVAVIAPNS